MFAVGAKLRQVGPIMFASEAYCIVKLPPVLYRGGGEKCLQLQVFRDATVVWAGGLHSGWNARMRESSGGPRAVRSVPPFTPCFGKYIYSVCYPGSLSREGEIACDGLGDDLGGGGGANQHPFLPSIHPSIHPPIHPPLCGG